MITDDYSKITTGYSLSLIYTSIVYLIGTILRNTIMKMTGNFMLSNIPYPENLMKIIRAITMARED